MPRAVRDDPPRARARRRISCSGTRRFLRRRNLDEPSLENRIETPSCDSLDITHRCGRGAQRIAALLSDLEPILVELSHAGKTLSPDELASIQKRIDSKNLLFKVRVMSAQGGGGDVPPPVNPNSNSL